MRGGEGFGTRRPRSGGGRISDVDEQEGWGVLKIGQFSWTSYVYCPEAEKNSTFLIA